MDKDEIIKELAEENAKLKGELQATKEHLKKYTAPVFCPYFSIFIYYYYISNYFYILYLHIL